MPGSEAWELEILFDGECPLCAREVAMLQRCDRRGRLRATDIAAPAFDARRYGTDFPTLMGRLHAALPSGELIEGVEVIRRAYAAVGVGWLVAPTRWPGLSWLSERAYSWFARNRLWLTGRSETDCAAGRCAID